MKLTDMIVSAIIKKGVMYEARNVNAEFEIPRPLVDPAYPQGTKIKIQFKCEHMTVRIEKEGTEA